MTDQHYFAGGGRGEQLLRFFNLLEPGHMVLSLSKLAIYVTLGGFAWAAFTAPAYLAPAIGALSAAMTHYGYRRWEQYRNGQPPYPKAPDPVDEAPPPPVPADQQ